MMLRLILLAVQSDLEVHTESGITFVGGLLGETCDLRVGAGACMTDRGSWENSCLRLSSFCSS